MVKRGSSSASTPTPNKYARKPSGSTTPGRGRGASAGAATPRGRGRGRGTQLSDMTSMALDYQVKVSPLGDAASRKGAGTASSSSSSSDDDNDDREATSDAPPPQAGSSSGLSSAMGGQSNGYKERQPAYAPKGVATPPSFQSNRSGSGASTPAMNGYRQPHYGARQYPNNHIQSQPRIHAGIGTYNRRPDRLASDPNLTKPIVFVKAAQQIKPTIDKEEQDRYAAQQKLDDLFKNASRAISIPVEPAPPSHAPVVSSDSMSRDISHSSSAKSSGSASKSLSPHATPFQQPSFLGSLRPDFAKKEPVQDVKGKSKATVEIVEPEIEQPVAYFIDVVGERNGSGMYRELAPKPPLRKPETMHETVQNETAQNKAAPAPVQNDEEESDTEDLFPRTIRQNASAPALPPTAAARSASEASQKPQPSMPAIETKPYARVVNDDADLGKIFQPFLPKLSQEARTLVAEATATPASQSRVPAPSKKVSKKQAKKAAKERKKERRRGGAGHPNGQSKGSKKEKKVPRTDDSDVEWGSDGPPAHLLKDDFEDAEEEMMALEISESRTSANKGGKKAKGNGRKSAVDLAVEDYLQNIAAQTGGGQGSDDEDAMSVDELARLTSFAKSLSGNAEHLTLDDLEDIAQIRAEESDNSKDDTSDSDDEDDDEVYEEEIIKKEFSQKVIQEESYPVYIGAPKNWESDPDDDTNKIFKSDDEDEDDSKVLDAWAQAGKQLMEDTSKEVSTDSSDDGLPGVERAKSDIDEDVEENKVQQADTIMAVESVEETLITESDDDEEDEDEEDDDEEDLEDELLRLSRPVRKNRQPQFEPDLFDDLLQQQWLKDKQKKAIYKQERALKRLEQKPTKANVKKAKRAASRAKVWDVDDDFNVLGGADLKIPGGRLPEFHKINLDLVNFIEKSGYQEYTLPPMDKKFRYAIHMLAEAYNLKSKSRGAGRDRHNVLYRTQHTSIRGANHRKIQKYLSITATWSSGGSKSFSYEYSRSGTSKSNKAGGGGAVSRNHEGAVVGEGADKIAADNIGHKMLAAMGWTEGMQIGRSGGIAEPLQAIVKTSKAGLGSGWVRYNRGVSTPGVDGGED